MHIRRGCEAKFGPPATVEPMRPETSRAAHRVVVHAMDQTCCSGHAGAARYLNCPPRRVWWWRMPRAGSAARSCTSNATRLSCRTPRASPTFPLRHAAFLVDGVPVTLVRPVPQPTAGAIRSASGSVRVARTRARTARASRIWVEGKHDAELVERVWGHDLRVDGVVVEPLDGVDYLADRIAEFDPAPDRRLGVLVDHLVAGSKESRLVAAVRSRTCW